MYTYYDRVTTPSSCCRSLRKTEGRHNAKFVVTKLPPVTWWCPSKWPTRSQEISVRYEVLTHLPWTKWPSFRRRHFQMHFLDWKRLNFEKDPKGPINNIPALVQIMAWRRSGDKPLSEPMVVSLLTHTCVTWPQWVNVESLLCSIYDDPGMH